MGHDLNLIALLPSKGRIFTGQGTNHEGESFVGRLEIQPLVDQNALMLHYTATGTDGRHLHKEATLLAMGQDGRLCLWPVMEELPFVLPHPQVSNGLDADGKAVVVFASGPHDATDVFREEIAIEVGPDGELGYAHSWGMPGGPFETRSRCALRVEA